MTYRILKTDKGYSVWFKNDYDNGGIKWERVIWEKEAYCRFQDFNFTDTIEEAKQRAAEHKAEMEKEYGVFVEEFTI